MMNTIREQKNLFGQRVLVRIDVNVPIKDGSIIDDTRIKASIPTLAFLHKHGAKVIVVAHLGRPGGQVQEELTLRPIAERLGILLGQSVPLIDDWQSKEGRETLSGMAPGEVTLLENIRFCAGETHDSPELAETLANLADIFVFDGFGVAHRKSASVSGVAALLQSYAGLLLEKEVKGLSAAIDSPAEPTLLILGGVKLKTKIPLLKKLHEKWGNVLLGGSAVNTYLHAKGYGIGASVFEEAFGDDLLHMCEAGNMVLPVDVIVGKKDGTSVRVVDISTDPQQICSPEEGIYDIGPKTRALFANRIKDAKTIIWNGSLGMYKQAPYHEGTDAAAVAMAKAAEKEEVFTVVGGGDTLQAIHAIGADDMMDLLSTGGGAMLAYLAGEDLPGLKFLDI